MAAKAARRSKAVKAPAVDVLPGHQEHRHGEYGEWLQDWRYLAYKGNGQANQPLLFVGSTGTGKSYMANDLFFKCAAMGDICIMPGDTAFEARHFLNYINKGDNPVRMRVLIPEEFKYDFQVFDFNRKRVKTSLETICKRRKIDLIRFNPREDNINNYIEPRQILVVMDCCYALPSRTKFWTFLFRQLKLRKRYAVNIITYLFHEFGTYFPVISFKDQFKYVDEFAQNFVEFRKFYMRGICLQQFPGQTYWKIEPQFEITVTKGANAGRKQKYDRKFGRGKRLDEYSIVWGGIEDVRIKMAGTFDELKQIWKVIPEEEIEFMIEDDDEDDKKSGYSGQMSMVLKAVSLRRKGYMQKDIAKEINRTQSQVSRILTKWMPQFEAEGFA